MRIAFVGKGGSGKTTLSSLFARHLAAEGLPVLAVDADINQHLAASLGMDPIEAGRIPAMGLEIGRLKTWLRGTNARITSNELMLKTTPPGTGSRFVRFGEPNPINGYFERSAGTVPMMAVGPFSDEDLGVRCYHAKTGALELYLNHLLDSTGEYVVVDMTAGADSFASGMFTKFDLTVLVVEPTVKSVGVYEQYRRYAAEYGIRLAVVGNKVEDEADRAYLLDAVGAPLIGFFERSQYVRSLERGDSRPFDELESENRAVLAAVRTALDAVLKDWPTFYRHMVEFHIKNADGWASAQLGADLAAQVDPDFAWPV